MLNSAHPLAISGIITIAIGLVVLLLGYSEGKSKNFKNHRKLMILSVITLSLFLVQYVIRLGVLKKETKFEGNENIRKFIYLPTLVIHVSLAIITLGLIVIHGNRTLTNQLFTNEKIPYFPKEYRNHHRSLGQIVFILWLISYIGGIIVFFFLYM